MIEKDKNQIIQKLNTSEPPEEVFTEGVSDLIVYNNIVKFNIFSRPIHTKESLNTMKINKTLTFTQDNFEKFLDQLNKEYFNIKKQMDNENLETKEKDEDVNLNEPPKGSRIL